MAEVNNRTLRLNATELKEMTKWPDPMIEEFLSLLDNLNNLIQSNNTITTVVDETEQLGTEVQGQIGWVISRMRAMGRHIDAVEELVAHPTVASRDDRVGVVAGRLARADGPHLRLDLLDLALRSPGLHQCTSPAGGRSISQPIPATLARHNTPVFRGEL